MKSIRIGFWSLSLAFCLFASCDEKEMPNYDPPSGGDGEEVNTAQVFVTSGDRSQLMEEQNEVSIIDNTETIYPAITVHADDQKQEIEGFGAALTGSSAYLIHSQLNQSQRNALLNDLFSQADGIGISYLRLTIGASDFSLEDFTYDEVPQGEEDPDLSNFTIEHDDMHIVPVLQDILSINPDLKLMGSPWSAPAWMKTSQQLAGGSLKPAWYDTYADYFVKYIQAYQDRGIEINAITPQNEPLHEAGYPTMYMSAGDQAEFIKNSLGPAFESENITTKIIAYDHNFDRPDYPMTVFEDEQAAEYVAGAAFHAYAGNVSAMSNVHNSFPQKGLYFTEISGGEWSTDFSNNLGYLAREIFMGTTKNWSKNVLLWNLALNENHGPTNNGCTNCRGVITITSSGEITRNEEYYALAHFSNFIQPGAHRVGVEDFEQGSQFVGAAFQNPDDSKVLVVLNDSDSERSFSAIMDGTRMDYLLSGHSLATFKWE